MNAVTSRFTYHDSWNITRYRNKLIRPPSANVYCVDECQLLSRNINNNQIHIPTGLTLPSVLNYIHIQPAITPCSNDNPWWNVLMCPGVRCLVILSHSSTATCVGRSVYRYTMHDDQYDGLASQRRFPPKVNIGTTTVDLYKDVFAQMVTAPLAGWWRFHGNRRRQIWKTSSWYLLRDRKYVRSDLFMPI